ncbi:MAG: S8 family serine peptidase [Deltaproteobacteria bacterium]|nr:S8 family serine peptidase [Deltaproteobacteria bacterium]
MSPAGKTEAISAENAWQAIRSLALLMRDGLTSEELAAFNRNVEPQDSFGGFERSASIPDKPGSRTFELKSNQGVQITVKENFHPSLPEDVTDRYFKLFAANGRLLFEAASVLYFAKPNYPKVVKSYTYTYYDNGCLREERENMGYYSLVNEKSDWENYSRGFDANFSRPPLVQKYFERHNHLPDRFKVEGRKIPVAVWDSGVDYQNLDILPYLDMPRAWDFIRDDACPYDVVSLGSQFRGLDSHGTAVTGAMIAVGLANTVSIVPLRTELANLVYKKDYSSFPELTKARDAGARIINLSSISPNRTPEWLSLVAANPDFLFVQGAGNDGKAFQDVRLCGDESPFSGSLLPCDEMVSLPAFDQKDFPNLITVAAMDRLEKGLAQFSTYGFREVTTAAPGEDILVPMKGGGVERASGTSLAAPYIAGVSANILAINPNLTPTQVKEIIVRSTRAIPALEDKVATGGAVDPIRAYTLAMASLHHK